MSRNADGAKEGGAGSVGEYVPFPILDQLYSQRSIGPTPFSSEKTMNGSCEPSAYVVADDDKDAGAAFHYRMTFPSSLHGTHQKREQIRPSRSTANFFQEASPETNLKTGISTLPAPNPYWTSPPMALKHSSGLDQKRLPRDTFHPLISALQAQENSKAEQFNPVVGYLSNASRNGPPCKAHRQTLGTNDGGHSSVGGGGGGGDGDDMDFDPDEDLDITTTRNTKVGRNSKKGDPKTAVGRAYSSEGAFHDPEHYSSKIIEVASTQPTSLTGIAAKAISKALHAKNSHSIPAHVVASRHQRVEPNSGPKGINANRYQHTGVHDRSNPVVAPSGAFREVTPALKTVLLSRTRDTRHRVAEVLADMYEPTQPPPLDVTPELAPLVEGELAQREGRRFGHHQVDSDDEDDTIELAEDPSAVVGGSGQLGLWTLALKRKGRRVQQVDDSFLPPNHPAKEVLGEDRKLRVLTPQLISVYNPGSSSAQVGRYLGGVGIRMAETLAQTKPPSQSSFHRDAKSREAVRQFSDIAFTPNNSFGVDSERLRMLLADKGEEVEDIFLDGSTVSEAALREIGTYCPNLKLLNVANCSELTDESFTHIVSRCDQLAYVNISGCTQLSGEAIAALLENCANLHVLCCSGLPKLDVSSAIAWTNLFRVPHLAVLDISFCEHITDEVLTSLAEHCRGLEMLDISGCSSIGDVGVASIGSSCTRLSRWKLRLCSGLSGASFEVLSLAPRNLVHLDLSGCSLNSKTLESIVKHLTCLRTLAIGGCSALDDEAVASVTRHCPALKALNLSCCVGVSLASCMALIHELQQLQRLIVSESTISNAEVVMLSSLRESCKIVRNQYRPQPPQKLIAFAQIETKKKAKPPAKKK